MKDFGDKTILITGGTGSFGGALLERLQSAGYREVRIFSRDEHKQDEMRSRLKNPRVKFYIGDVRDQAGVDSAMRGVDFVFHAAALKQVPSCEFFPMQAVMTNIVGSHNVIRSAIRHGVKKVVCLGTDKAVYPINAMGMTKALMEKVAQSEARAALGSETVVCSVRYGNVMCSRGSVIPLFMRQIRAGEPITVTAPEMTRFMLPLSEAIELVLFAFQQAQQGDIFIRKAPACTIGDLAEALKALARSSSPVKAIGIRHGEKLHETLATCQELRRAEDLGGYYRVRMDDRDLNYEKYFTEGERRASVDEDYTSANTQRLDLAQTIELLESLPEVRSWLVTGAGQGLKGAA